MSEKPTLTEEQKNKLDSNIRSMLENGASEQDVIAYTEDFKKKFSSGEGEPVNFTEGSQEPQEQPSQPSEQSGTKPSPFVEQELPVGVAAPQEQPKTGRTTPASPTPLTQQNLPVGVASQQQLKKQEIDAKVDDVMSKPHGDLPPPTPVNQPNEYETLRADVLNRAEQQLVQSTKEAIMPMQQELADKLYQQFTPFLEDRKQVLQEALNNGEISEEEANKQLQDYAKNIDEKVALRIQANPQIQDELRNIQQPIIDDLNKKLNAVNKMEFESNRIKAQTKAELEMSEKGNLEALGDFVFNEILRTQMVPAQITQLASQVTEEFEDPNSTSPIIIYDKEGGLRVEDKTPAELQAYNLEATERMRNEMRQTLSLLDEIEKGEWGRAGTAALGNSISFLASSLRALGTRGLSIVAEIGEPMWADAVHAKANKEGKTVEQILLEDAEDELTAMSLAGVAALAERAGMKGMTKTLKSKFAPALSQAAKRSSLGAATKETVTELSQGYLENLNSELQKEGVSLYSKEATKKAVEKVGEYFSSKEALDTGLSTFAGALILQKGTDAARSLANLARTTATPQEKLTELTPSEVEDIIKNPELKKQEIEELFQQGYMSKKQADAAKRTVDAIVLTGAKVKEGSPDKGESVRLIAERELLEKQKENLDETQRGDIEARIEGINNRLKEIANVQGQTTQRPEEGTVRNREQEQPTTQEAQDSQINEGEAQPTGEPTEQGIPTAPTREEVGQESLTGENARNEAKVIINRISARKDVDEVFQSVRSNTPINENKLAQAQEALLKEIDVIENSKLPQVVKDRMIREVEVEFDKLENYELTTETKTRTVTKKRPTRVPRESKGEQRKTPKERLINRAVQRVEGTELTREGFTPQEGATTVLEEQDGKLVLQEFDETGQRTNAQVLEAESVNDFDLVETVKDENDNVIGATLRNKNNDGEVFTIMDEDLALDLAIEKTKAEIGELTFEEEQILEEYEQLKPRSRAIPQRKTEEVPMGEQAQVSEEMVGEVREQKQEEAPTETTQEVEQAKKNLQEVWNKWKKSQRNLNLAFDPKSTARQDVELFNAVVDYVKAIGAKTAKDVYEAVSELTDFSVAISKKYADKVLGAIYDIKEVRDDQGRLLAPNGKPSNLNEQQWKEVRTPQFKNWFGDWENDPQISSKVVDENGEPLVVFHGSPATDITSFDRNKSKRASSGLKEFGVYFGTNKNLAKLYSEAPLSEDYKRELAYEISQLEDKLSKVRTNRDFDEISGRIETLRRVYEGYGGRVYPVYLNLRNIVEFDADYNTNIEAWNNLKADLGYKTAVGRDAMEAYAGLNNVTGSRIKVDGIKAKNVIDMSLGTQDRTTERYKKAKEEFGGDVYLVFDGQPQNIKMADGSFSNDRLSEARQDFVTKWNKWKDSQRNLGVAFDHKSKAKEDVELLNALIKYLTALGVKTAQDVIDNIKSFAPELKITKETANAIIKKINTTPTEDAKTLATQYGYKAPIEAVRSVNRRLGKNYETIEEITESELQEASNSRFLERVSDLVGDNVAVREEVSKFINEQQQKGSITTTKAASLLQKLNKTSFSSAKQLADFMATVSDTFDRAQLNKDKKRVKEKLKRAAKRAKGKTTLSSLAKDLAGLNLSNVINKDVLAELEMMAEEVQKTSPKISIQEVNNLIERVRNTATPQTTPKTLEQKIKDNTRRRIDAKTPQQELNAEIERQQLVAEYLSSVENPPIDLIQELEEELPINFKDKNITSYDVAKKVAGDISRANTAVNKAESDGAITPAKAKELRDGIKEATEQYKKEIQQQLKGEKDKYTKNKKKVKLPKSEAERYAIEKFLEAKPVEDLAWYAKANDVLDTLANGVIPYKEMVGLQAYSAYQSKAAADIAQEVQGKTIKGTVAEVTAQLGKKDASQRERNVLGIRTNIIWDNVYQPMVSAIKRSHHIAENLIKDWQKSVIAPSLLNFKARKRFNDDMATVGIVMHYLQEQALLGAGIKADGVDVGNRDIFGILLGNKSAMDAAGMDDKTQANFTGEQALNNYTQDEIKKLKEVYERLKDPELGYVDVQNLDPKKVLDERQYKIFEKSRELFDKTSEYQEAGNLSRGVDFERRGMYFPTKRKGGSRVGLDKPVSLFTTFTSEAGAGKEKTTYSLLTQVGGMEFMLNKVALDHVSEVALDYVFSIQQPVTNSLLTSVVNNSNSSNIAMAIKNDYNRSLIWEATSQSDGWTRALNTLLGARYAKSLLDPLRSVVEIIAGTLGGAVKTRSISAITNVGDKRSWRLLNQLEKDFGIEIADFKDVELNRKSIQEGLNEENVYARFGRRVITAPEYVTAMSLFMPTFRQSFYEQTGVKFEQDKYLNNPEYRKQYSDEIAQAVKRGQGFVERVQGSKVKGGTRRSVEFIPKVLAKKISKDPNAGMVGADTPAGRLIGFFGNYTYREQGEFFTSLKFIANDIFKKGRKPSKAELSNAAGVLTNAITYSYLMGLYYIGRQVLLGDDDEKEEALKELEEMTDPATILQSIGSQIAFLGLSKYGKMSRVAAIISLSEIYTAADLNNNKQAKEAIEYVLREQFYVYKPIDLRNKYAVSMYAFKEGMPALHYLSELASASYKDAQEMMEDEDAMVALSLAVNLTNLGMAVGMGTQLPMTPVVKDAIDKAKNNKSKGKSSVTRAKIIKPTLKN